MKSHGTYLITYQNYPVRSYYNKEERGVKMSFQDVLNVAIVVILVYLCLSGLVGRICKSIEITAIVKCIGEMSKSCDNGPAKDIFVEMSKFLKK